MVPRVMIDGARSPAKEICTEIKQSGHAGSGHVACESGADGQVAATGAAGGDAATWRR